MSKNTLALLIIIIYNEIINIIKKGGNNGWEKSKLQNCQLAFVTLKLKLINKEI